MALFLRGRSRAGAENLIVKHEQEFLRGYPDLIAGQKPDRRADPLAIDHRAVHAFKVFDEEAAAAGVDRRMFPAHTVVVDNDVAVVGIAADDVFAVARQRYGLAVQEQCRLMP